MENSNFDTLSSAVNSLTKQGFKEDLRRRKSA